MKKFLASFIGNKVLVSVIMITVIVSGFIASKCMVRENFPEFSLDMISVSIPYPGADPKEVEEGISIKIEEAIRNVNGIKQCNTFSIEGLCRINIEVGREYNISDVIDDVRTKVGAISTFPAGAERPIIKELILRDPVLLMYISGNISEKAVKKLSLEIRDEIQRLPEVSQVEIFGNKKCEIAVEVSEKNLREYDVSLSEIATSISQNNLNLAAGKIRDEQEEIRVKTIGRKYTGKELSSILVVAKPDGESVPLCRLAESIKDDFTEDSIVVNVNGSPGTVLTVYKTKEEDSLRIADAVTKYITEKQLVLPKNINLKILYDNTEMLRSRINLLLKNGILGLIIVFLSLSLFLNIRLSFWTGIGIIVAVSGALTVVYLLGGTINMVSLFGFIMVLGIVVDDAIVVGEAIYFNKKKGKSDFNAAVHGIYEVGIPVFAAIVTTIVAFLPLFYVGGIMGKFISILPAVVIACLIVSLLESLLILPSHLSSPANIYLSKYTKNFVLKIGSVQKFLSEKMDNFIHHIYAPFLSKALHWRYVLVSIAVALLFISVGIVRGGILKFEIFPTIDSFVMTSTVELPNGTPLEITERVIKQIDHALVLLAEKIETKSGDPLIKSRLSMTGQTLEEPMPRYGSNLGSVQAILLESENRGIHSDDLMILWEKEVGGIPEIKSLKFEGLSAGPPGLPVEIWLKGMDLDALLEAANDLMAHLGNFDGIYQISSDSSLNENEVCLELTSEGRYLGLNVVDLAKQVNDAYYGAEALKIQRGQDNIKIKICYTEDERSRISNIGNIDIRIPKGGYVKLRSVANISFKRSPLSITRTDGMRRISVSAGVDARRANANEILTELTHSCFPDLLKKYPGISISPQGEQKKMRESFGSLTVGFPMAVVVIFMIVSAIFHSYLQPMTIILTIPFGIIGSMIGHLLLGYNMSIMSIFGMVALTGVVVNDAIILIERINTNLSLKMPFFEAVINGSSRRFMAVFLTTISTVGGLSPIILETDIQAKFLIPMAISMASGVAFASVMTLVLVPSLLTIFSDMRLICNKVTTGKWVKRELLEPGQRRTGSNI